MLVTITDQNIKVPFINWLQGQFGGSAYFNPADTLHVSRLDVTDPKNPKIVVVTAFHRWTDHSCEVAVATDGSKQPKVDRKYIYTCFDYVFNHVGRERINAHVAVDNHKSIAVQEMLGLTRVGLLEDNFGPGKHGYLYGITKTQWQNGRWATPTDD